jgi:3'(2'), 5'-bisphosphate nucleotidase
MRPDPRKLLDPALAIARQAGREILEVYRSDFTVEMKADHSPVTPADRAAHRVITEELARLTPGVPVWSEESTTAPFEERSRWDLFWLVDPLDGTTEFVKKNGEFTVNLALIEGHEPVLGVVHVPVLERDYFGGRGCGAFRRDDASAPRAIAVRRPAQDPPRVVASRSHRTASLGRFLERLGLHELAVNGSSLKLCLVAEGAADIYPCLGPTSEWDTAAGQAVVEAAGGQVVDAGGRSLRYNRHADPLNPWFLAFGDAARHWTTYVPPQTAP